MNIFQYLPLMAEAIMLFVGDDIWSRHLSRRSKYLVHAILISAATIFIIIGNALVFHFLSPGYHLYTAHGITGKDLTLDFSKNTEAQFKLHKKKNMSISNNQSPSEDNDHGINYVFDE